MEPMFVDQAVTFVKDILQTNKSIRLFIDSDYTYMNEAMPHGSISVRTSMVTRLERLNWMTQDAVVFLHNPA